MSSNYYFLYSSLPEISFDDKLDYRELAYLFDEVSESMSDADKIAMRYVRYPIDNTNLAMILEEKSDAESHFLPGGNFSVKDLEAQIGLRDTIPVYMYKFLEFHNQSQVPFSSTNHIDLLNDNFYNEVIGLHEGEGESSYDYQQSEISFNSYFIKRWYVFERDFNNVLTAIECLKHNEPIERRETLRIDMKMGQRLLGDYDVTQSLRQSKSYDYSLSGMLPWMTRVLNLNSENILNYEKQLLLIRLEMLDELAGDDNFSLHAILAYFIKLQLLIRWSSLDETKGKNFIDNLSKKIMNSVVAAK